MTLNNSKTFPSRVSVSESSLKQFQPIARRLYRILGHAYFQHRAVFDAYDARYRMLERFTKLSKKYDLLPEGSYIIPSSY